MSPPPRAPRPVDAAELERLAMRYVGRYATTAHKLGVYLRRKLAAAGWVGEGAPPVEALVGKAVRLGYVDDRAFAVARGAALGRRGYGGRRVAETLRAAGIAADDAAPATDAAERGALAAALAYARRRRIGPFAAAPADRPLRERWVASLVRAGHPLPLARRVAALPPARCPRIEPVRPRNDAHRRT